MTEGVVITEENSGFRFSWGLAFAGGIAAIAVTLVLLILGSGFGLLLVSPFKHPSGPAFLTAGAIYFLAAQAFGFAVGGHLAGRLLGPVVETRGQEELRAAAHGLVSWAIAIIGTLGVVSVAGLAAAGGGAAIAGLYGVHDSRGAAANPSAYLVDVLFRPESGPGAEAHGSSAQEAAATELGPHAEAERILDAALLRGETLTPDDRGRLADLVANAAAISRQAAAVRVDRLQADVHQKTEKTADAARKGASYAGLWIAFSLLFGAVVSVFAAISARLEDDRAA